MCSSSFYFAGLISSFHFRDNSVNRRRIIGFLDKIHKKKQLTILLTAYPQKIVVVMLWITFIKSL